MKHNIIKRDIRALIVWLDDMLFSRERGYGYLLLFGVAFIALVIEIVKILSDICMTITDFFLILYSLVMFLLFSMDSLRDMTEGWEQ